MEGVRRALAFLDVRLAEMTRFPPSDDGYDTFGSIIATNDRSHVHHIVHSLASISMKCSMQDTRLLLVIHRKERIGVAHVIFLRDLFTEIRKRLRYLLQFFFLLMFSGVTYLNTNLRFIKLMLMTSPGVFVELG